MKRILVFFTLMFGAFLCSFAQEKDVKITSPPISDQTQTCIDCHESINPGIVHDWRTSRHSYITPETALQKPSLERRISSDLITENLRSVTVGCYECHSLNASSHQDNFEHFDYNINVIVSPYDCKICHFIKVEQYSNSKKAHALDILQKNPMFHNLVDNITSVKEVKGNKIYQHEASETIKGETCYSCHGTTLKVQGTKIVANDFEAIEVPNLMGWPNQGVGRINPDGSLGACTACHPRHSFSIEIARKPYTCSQCHLQPDVPAWEVYKESKHGNIFLSKQHKWNWENVPWKAGIDLAAPTCATCHNSLLSTNDGEILVNRTHDFGERLWVRIFGVIYSHPQSKNAKTYLIKNKNDLPFPTTFVAELASDYLIDKTEQMRRQNEMKQVCQSCHSTDWVNGHFAQLDNTIIETDKMVLAATQLLQKAWDQKLANPQSPFDEAIEKKWIAQWLFYANSVRYGSAMGGPDYASFKNGWWELTKNLQEMQEIIELRIDSRIK